MTVLDTHQAVKDLTAASLSDAQAEAIVRLWQQSREADLSQLVTKTDLLVATGELHEEIVELGRRIDGVERRIDGVEHQIAAMESRLLTRLGGLMAAGIGLIPPLVSIL